MCENVPSHDTLEVALMVHSSEQFMNYISHCVFGCVFFIVIGISMTGLVDFKLKP